MNKQMVKNKERKTESQNYHTFRILLTDRIVHVPGFVRVLVFGVTCVHQ